MASTAARAPASPSACHCPSAGSGPRPPAATRPGRRQPPGHHTRARSARRGRRQRGGPVRPAAPRQPAARGACDRGAAARGPRAPIRRRARPDAPPRRAAGRAAPPRSERVRQRGRRGPSAQRGARPRGSHGAREAIRAARAEAAVGRWRRHVEADHAARIADPLARRSPAAPGRSHARHRADRRRRARRRRRAVSALTSRGRCLQTGLGCEERGESRQSAATSHRAQDAHQNRRRSTSSMPAPRAGNPAETSVAVLNGTGTTGLAHRISGNLHQSGYSKATALNGRPPGANQVTVVEYASGHRSRRPGRRTRAWRLPSATDGRDRRVVVGLGDRGGDRRPRQGCDRPIAGFLDIPERSAKPRERGLTHVIDRGLSVAEVDKPAGGRGQLRRRGQARLGHGAGDRQPQAQARALRRARHPGRARGDAHRAGDQAGQGGGPDRVAA